MEASSRDVQGQGEDSMKVYYRGMSLAMNALFGSRAVVQGQGKSMEVFREGICLVINSCGRFEPMLNSEAVALSLS